MGSPWWSYLETTRWVPLLGLLCSDECSAVVSRYKGRYWTSLHSANHDDIGQYCGGDICWVLLVNGVSEVGDSYNAAYELLHTGSLESQSHRPSHISKAPTLTVILFSPWYVSYAFHIHTKSESVYEGNPCPVRAFSPNFNLAMSLNVSSVQDFWTCCMSCSFRMAHICTWVSYQQAAEHAHAIYQRSMINSIGDPENLATIPWWVGSYSCPSIIL